MVLALAGPGGIDGGPTGQVWPRVESDAASSGASIGGPGLLHDLLALMSAPGITAVVALREGRPRPRLIGEVGASVPAGHGQPSRAGLRVVAPRPTHLAVRGLFAVRAPPTFLPA